ncbi:MAG: proteasome subunit alpha [Nitrospinaceae bacterium]
MFEEPFRWMEAISTRHSYVREKLQKGQPVLAVPYNEGALLLGFSPQPGKIFEVYDRIAMGGLGHPADVEKLRMTLLDMAHLEGFNRSAQDVTIARLLQFGVAPSLKQNFEEVMRAPYLIQLILAELDAEGQTNFYRMSYDGYWEKLKHGGAIAGDAKVVEWLDKEIEKAPFRSLPLDQALSRACRLWEEGKKHGSDQEENNEEESDGPPKTLKEVFEKWNLEAAVLCGKTTRKSIYRPVSQKEIEQLRASVTES